MRVWTMVCRAASGGGEFEIVEVGRGGGVGPETSDRSSTQR